MKKVVSFILIMILSLSIVGCTVAPAQGETVNVITDAASEANSESSTEGNTQSNSESNTEAGSSISLTAVEGSKLNVSELFTERDLEQNVDLNDAIKLNVTSNGSVDITEEGVYLISGEATDAMIVVAAPEDAKVQLVLDGVTITNQSTPAIYIKSGDKVFITTTANNSTLTVNGAFTADGDTNTDAVVFSKSDLVLNGTGILTINSATDNAITSKDDLKITGGTYVITAEGHGLEANDGIYIYEGTFTIKAQSDAIHSENDEDQSVGAIYIRNGKFDITAGDDAVRATTVLQIDGGVINIQSSTEGLEATYIQINGSELTLYSADDGINATNKSAEEVMIQVNGGTIDVTMGAGDTDGFDSNGSIEINEGIISVSGQSAFDADGTATLNGGTVTVNGTVITEITLQQMGPGGMGKKRP